MYQVIRFPYCGLSIPVRNFETAADAREHVAGFLRRMRGRYPVQTLARGARWEVCEPDGAAMVPDACGTLRLEHVTFECRECGSQHETRDDAAECCAYIPEDDCNEE